MDLTRDEILQKMQTLRVHAAGAPKAEKARLNRDYRLLWERLQEIDGTPRTDKTMAKSLKEEEEALRRRFIHHTRPQRPLSLEEAIELAKRVDVDGQ